MEESAKVLAENADKEKEEDREMWEYYNSLPECTYEQWINKYHWKNGIQ